MTLRSADEYGSRPLPRVAYHSGPSPECARSWLWRGAVRPQVASASSHPTTQWSGYGQKPVPAAAAGGSPTQLVSCSRNRTRSLTGMSLRRPSFTERIFPA